MGEHVDVGPPSMDECISYNCQYDIVNPVTSRTCK